MKILAIETSCDETAAAVISEKDNRPVVLSNVVSSQIDIHKEYGGVVPEVAARAHIESVIPVIKASLKKAKIDISDIDYFTVTQGPGLIGSLVVGVETAKALAAATSKPLIPVNHLEGHIYANFLSETEKPQFPLLSLLVSGGHTLLIYIKDHLSYEIVGQTRDDAAGEAFDKGAKLLGIGYPGGPIVAKLAERGDENKFPFPLIDLTPLPKRNNEGYLEKPEPSLDFSFSGLKTALLNIVKTRPGLTEPEVKDLAASFQKSIVDNLSQNVMRAIKKYQPKTFILSGGVAANQKLRETLGVKIHATSPKIRYLTPDFSLCTDNAAMVGAVAFYKIKLHQKSSPNFVAEPNLKLT